MFHAATDLRCALAEPGHCVPMERGETVRTQDALELGRDLTSAIVKPATMVHEDRIWLRPIALETNIFGAA